MAKMGLSAVKSKLENTIEKLLKDAYMSQFTKTGADPDGFVEDKMKEAADKFAKAAAGPVATAIQTFVLELKLTIQIPPSVISPPAPPVLPGGPCSGSISPEGMINIS